MKYIDWSKAPEGATHGAAGGYNGWADIWYKKEGGKWHAWLMHGDTQWDLNIGPCGRTDLFEVPAGGWNGTGLPPVETVCEVNHDGGWYETTIVGYDPEDGAVIFKTHEHCEVPYDGYTTPDRFRPIRTPEQIAAEERQVAAQQIMVDAGITDSAFKDDPEARVWVENLIDKGWRKTVGGAE